MTGFLTELPAHELSLLSVNEQDGILAHIFSNIPSHTATRYCVQIGFNGSKYSEEIRNNTANLILNHGWDGLIFDKVNKNSDINLHRKLITSKNVCNVLKQHGCPHAPDYISIDIKTTDIWIMAAVMEELRPSVVTVPYNCNLPFAACIAFPDAPSEMWQGDSVMSSSANAISLAAKERGYVVVYIGSTEMFLVRHDLIENQPLLPITYFVENQGRMPVKRYANCNSGREDLLIDYRIYQQTGDMKRSRRAARSIVKKYLCSDTSLAADSTEASPPDAFVETASVLRRHKQTRIRRLLSHLTPKSVSNLGKIRVGAEYDGGYIMVDDLKSVDLCISIGIGDNVSWDLQMADLGAKVIQFDHTVDAPGYGHSNFEFRKQAVIAKDGPGIGGMPLSKLLKKHCDGVNGLIVKMDIEGDEWGVFSETAVEDFAKIDQLIVEFHGLKCLTDEAFLRTAEYVIEKLDSVFFSAHVHGNNFGGFANACGIPVPDVLEVLFVSRRKYEFVDEALKFPTSIDAPCDPRSDDLYLGEFRFD